MNVRSHSFTILVRSPGRQQEEEWESIEPRESAFWTEAASKLSHRRYEHSGCEVEVTVDWTPLARRLIRDYKLLIPLRTGQPPATDWFAKIDRPLRLSATCYVRGGNHLSDYEWYPGFFLEYFLYEIFTIANLSCPGAAEFLNFEVRKEGERRSPRLELSAFYFGEWMIATRQGAKPEAKVIDLATTINWFQRVNPRVTQKAENRTQRALYAMYQLCKSDGQVDIVLWLFHALESLLGTRVGENFSGLIRRAALLLELGEDEKRQLSKKLRELYDLRSAFVHGGYEVAHPLHSGPIDPRLDEDFLRILKLSTYGFSILAALLQAMVIRQLPLVTFEERIIV